MCSKRSNLPGSRCAIQPRDGGSCPETAIFEPACRHFQGEFRGLPGAVRLFGLRLHFLDIDDAFLFVDEGNGERNQGISHPHALGRGQGENEQHAVVTRHAFSVHQALGA